MEEINQMDVAKLHTPLNAMSKPLSERQLIHKLIAQYLAHDGYVETAHAFAQEVHAENAALASGAVQDVENLRPEEDHDAVNRQSKYLNLISHCMVRKKPLNPETHHSIEIRSAILDGDIDRALYLTEKHFPKVLRDNENIYFRLRCRKYIEMIKRAVDVGDSTSSTSKTGLHVSNGRVPSIHDDYDIFDHQMELDEQLGATHHRPTFNGTSTIIQDYESAMDVTPEGPGLTRDQLTSEALRYGAELKSEFQSDPRKEVKRALDETLALIAYDDPKDSPLKGLLDVRERVPVAEELNSAILGKPFAFLFRTSSLYLNALGGHVRAAGTDESLQSRLAGLRLARLSAWSSRRLCCWGSSARMAGRGLSLTCALFCRMGGRRRGWGWGLEVAFDDHGLLWMHRMGT